jgi:hypothetical protein
MKNNLKGSLDQKYVPKIPSLQELESIENKAMWKSIFKNRSSLDEFQLLLRFLKVADLPLSFKNSKTVFSLIKDAVRDGILSKNVQFTIPIYRIMI